MELSRDPEIDLYKYSQLTLTKEQNQYNGAKTVFSKNYPGIPGQYEEMNLNKDFTLFTKIN